MFDEDEVLNLEDKFYQEGFEDGRNENLEQNLLEGRQYGLQVGFQRVSIVGQIQSICETIQTITENNSLKSHCQVVLDEIKQLRFTNEETDVAQFGKVLVKLKNKLRLILMVWNRSNRQQKILYDDVFAVNQKFSGTLTAYTEDTKEVESNSKETNQDAKHDW
ncbi:hypothetical protein ACO0QE_002212 [Hanseniaspora vineae]